MFDQPRSHWPWTLVAIAAICGACATSPTRESGRGTEIHSSVDSICDETPEKEIPKHYFILPKNEKTDPNDLYYLEASRMVESTLTPLGYERVQKPNGHTLKLFFDFGFGETKKKNHKNLVQRLIFLKAVGSDQHVFWQTSIQSWGTSRSYTKIFPAMLTAAQPFIGKKLESPKRASAFSEDDLVKKIRGHSEQSNISDAEDE